MGIYLDMVMGLHFLVSLLLMLAAKRMAGMGNRWLRLVFAAALNGLYAGFCLATDLKWLGTPLCRAGVLLLTGLVAFGWRRATLGAWGMYTLLNLMLDTVANGMTRGEIWTVALAAGVIGILYALHPTGETGGGDLVSLEIRHRGKSVRLTALVDTGNRLRDPITGEPVLIIDSRAAGELTGLTREELKNPMENLEKCRGLRLIPYHGIGDGGFLLAMRFPEVFRDGKRSPGVVAFAPGSIGNGEGYRALTGGR